MAQATIVNKEFSPIFLFNQALNEDTGEKILQWLIEANEHGAEELNLYINSPGGHLDQAIAIIDMMTHSPFKITTIAQGMVASAGLMIFMAGDQRVSFPNTIFMSHQFSGGSYGKAHDLEAGALANKMYKTFMHNLYKTHTNQSQEVIQKTLLGPTDFYMTAKQAVKFGIADAIVEPHKLFGHDGRTYQKKVDRVQERLQKLAVKAMNK